MSRTPKTLPAKYVKMNAFALWYLRRLVLAQFIQESELKTIMRCLVSPSISDQLEMHKDYEENQAHNLEEYKNYVSAENKSQEPKKKTKRAGLK